MRNVVCPECAAAVQIPAGLGIPSGGRLVSCGRSSIIWRIHPHEVPAEPPPPAAVAAADTSATAVLSRSRRGPARNIALASLVLAVGIGTLAMLAFLSRHHLAVWMPSTRGIFLTFGISVKPSSIEAAIVGWRAASDGALLVGYRVGNPTALSQAMPEICVEGRGEEGETAFRRCFGPDIEKLPPDAVREAEFLVLDMHGAVRVVELRAASAQR